MELSVNGKLYQFNWNDSITTFLKQKQQQQQYTLENPHEISRQIQRRIPISTIKLIGKTLDAGIEFNDQQMLNCLIRIPLIAILFANLSTRWLLHLMLFLQANTSVFSIEMLFRHINLMMKNLNEERRTEGMSQTDNAAKLTF